MASADIHKLASARLATQGQRYTANRRRVVDALVSAPGPLTIAGILASDEELAQSSAYRNLVVLTEASIVHRIVTSDDHARFELAEDITGEHHHHLICDGCGVIYDITLPAQVERDLEAALDREADRMIFHGDHHRVDLTGTCQTCHD